MASQKEIYIFAILLFLPFISCGLEQKKSSVSEDEKILIGTWSYAPIDGKDQLFQEEYSWGFGWFVPNGSISIDWCNEDEAYLCIDVLGGRTYIIKNVRKEKEGVFILSMIKHPRFSGNWNIESGEIAFSFVDEHIVSVNEAGFPIFSFSNSPGHLYKISGPNM